VLKLQTEVATSVASALRVTLLGDVSSKIELGGTRNPAAFDAYLRGQKALSAIHDDSGFQTAINAYTEAIGLDANYALAYAQRSLALTNSANNSSGSAVSENLENAHSDALRAIELAPTLAEAHVALAVYYDSGPLEFERAKEEYERAHSLATGNAQVMRSYGLFAARMGLTEAGLAAARRAVVLDPLNVSAHRDLAFALLSARRY
jgi:tetratricopeptide (TPR) repeat protein